MFDREVGEDLVGVLAGQNNDDNIVVLAMFLLFQGYRI